MRYDTSFQPPAPVLDLVVRNPYAGAEEGRCRALLDSAAEISVIPQDVANALQLAEAQRVIARTWDGTSREVTTHIVRLEFEGGVVPLIEVVSAERSTALLGRDVLNHLRLLLDGPAFSLEILTAQRDA